MKKLTLLITILMLAGLVLAGAGCGGERPKLEKESVEDEPQPAREEEATGCTTKFYSVGQQITGLKGKDGKFYQVVVGDVVSSGLGEYEVALELYEQDSFLAVDSDIFSASEENIFPWKFQNKVHVKEIYKFETGSEPVKISIEICR